MASETFVRQLRDLMTRYLPRIPCEDLSPDSHLTYQLGLDSVELMQLLVLLENECGYALPEEALSAGDLERVSDLEVLVRPTAANDTVGEPELDVKVHCVVSCLCHPIKARGLDHRPLYFGVWDAEVFVDDQARLRYHDEAVDHGFFLTWFERLYGAEVSPWYDPALSKAHNIASLETRLAQRKPREHLMVMLDLYRLPERENRFQLNPFPHYVLLENDADPDRLWMWDPDFRWEGSLDRRRVLHAVESPAVAGGVCLDTCHLHAPEPEAVAAYFEVCFQPTVNTLTQAVEQVVRRHLPEAGEQPLDRLGSALAELPVLAIRKYAYEHGLAYFWRALERPADEFEHWCDEIEALVKGYDAVLYRANKVAHTRTRDDFARLSRRIAEQHQREYRIKRALFHAFNDWRKQSSIRGSVSREVAAL
ncbi:acyl carrier protein [Marinimicrobium koreense]|uniref:Acyl carrier protein n=1 Tax=Marinimicrobium koreense TaxID=306545 RepID=A0A3N1NQZ9_9GAMM|nr:DUF6005 family protein [Marinimicrobium koreense]ROQ18583.1 acyl carrier protein [Marinimicrobium koreense]